MTSNRPAVLLASSRGDGNTRELAQFTFPPGEAHYEDLAQLRIGYYSYTQEHEDDDFLPLVRRLHEYRLWIIATPLYWYTMSAQAKTFVDRLSDLLSFHKDDGRRLRGKAWAVVATGSDTAPPAHFDEPFALTCEYLGMRYLGWLYAQYEDRSRVEPDVPARAAEFARRVRSESG